MLGLSVGFQEWYSPGLGTEWEVILAMLKGQVRLEDSFLESQALTLDCGKIWFYLLETQNCEVSSEIRHICLVVLWLKRSEHFVSNATGGERQNSAENAVSFVSA